MENIRIYAPGDILLLDVPVTAKSTHEQELMKSDHIHLEWSDSDCVNLPLGAYVRVDNIVYTLAKPYYPDSRNMGKYDYSVDFEHELMLLQRVPFLLYREDGVECDWNYTGLFQDLKNALKQAIFKAIGVQYDIRIDDSANRAISLSFSNADIFSALNSIAEDLECEWWYEDVIAGVKSSAIIYFGTKCVHEHGEDSVLELTAGQEVGYPSSNNKGEFFNRFFVFGSTRNIPQDYEGANANTIVNKRLTLDPSIHPDGYMDLPAFDINGNILETTGTDPNGRPFWKEDGSLGYYRVDQSVTDGVRTFTKVLQLDDIYPRADLQVAHVAKCVKFVRDQNGEKVELTPGVFSTFSVFYVQFADVTGKVFDINPTTYQPKTNPDGHVLPNTTPGIHFNSGALTGREFEVFKYHEVAPAVKNETDGESVSFAEFSRGDINTGIFEIQYKEDNTIIIPNDGIEPIANDKAVVFNIRMPEAYVTKGYKDLDQAALVQIFEATKDSNEYTVQGNNVYFAENEPSITIGRHVYFYTQGRKIDTRVVKLTRNLDRRFEIELAFGKAVTRGAIQTILTNIESTQQSVVTTQLESRQAVKEAQKRAYDAQRELHDMIFDADDYFKDGNIRPETIETLMLTVGAVSTNLELTDVTFCANNDGTSTENPNAVNIIQGTSAKLRHYGLSDSEVKEWTLTKPATAYTKDEDGRAFVSSTAYYLYARCSTSGSSGSFVFSTNKYKYNQFVDTNHVYYFLVGVLSSVLDGYRLLNMTYGNTAITGDQIRTGSIRSNNDDVVIDLNKGTIKSNKGITFIPHGETAPVTIEDYQARIKNLYEYLADAVKLASTYGTTTIDGGVVLTSAMVLAHPVTKAVMAGLNGVLSDAKDVAAWFGGNMWDVENLKSGENASDAATSLFRRDGTGYLAGGNIRWDERGFIYADPTSFLVGTGADGQAVQLALYFVKLKEDQTIEGLKRFVSGIGVGNGSGLIEWDATRNMFRFNAGIYSTSDIVAYGVGDSDIQTVIDVVEAYLAEHGVGGGGLSSVVITSSGSGNVVSGMSKTLSDDGKTLTLTLTKGISAYIKPSTGIPLADLASSVQTALGKADTALQEHQSLQGYATEQWVNNKGYLTSHQDISGKADKSSTVSTIAYDSTNKKITKTINGTTSDVVSVSTLKSAMDAVTSTDLGNAIAGEVQARINAINALVVASAGGSGKYIQSISQTDGKISATSAILNKSAVGLGNVDNTADENKNVASAIVANRLPSCKAYKNNANSYPWCLVLSSSVMSGSYSDLGGVYMIHNAYQGGLFGIFRVIMRTNDVDATSGNEAQLTLQWIIKQSDDSSWDVKAGFKKTKKNAYVDVYYRSNGAYASAVITKLESSHRGVVSTGDFTMIDSNETATEHTNCYASLGTQGAYRTYDMIVGCGHSANVGFANSANQLANIHTLWGQSFDGSADVNGYVIINNDYGVEGKDTGGTARTLLTFNASNQVNLAYGTAGAGYDTYINGNNTIFRQGTGHSEKMRITSGGNVGIGTTSPQSKLDVAGDIWTDKISFKRYTTEAKSYIESVAGEGTTALNAMQFTTEGGQGAFIFRTNTNSTVTEKARISNNGNVGIGTTSPSEKLEVDTATSGGFVQIKKNSNAGADCGFKVSNTTYALALMIGSGNVNRGLYDIANKGWWIYRDATTNTLIPTGNVGIGTTSPQQKLHVSGVTRTRYVDFYSKDAETTRAGWVGRGSDANNGLTLYSDNDFINIDSNAEINLKAGHKQVVKVVCNATVLQSYAVIGEASTNCEVANLNFSVNGYDSKARLQFLKNGNFYIGRNYESTIGNDNAAVRIASTGGLVLSSTAALSGTRDNAIYIRPSGSNSNTNQVKFESGGVTISASSANGLVIKRTDGSFGAFVNYKAKNQDAIYWQVGSSSEHKFAFNYTSSSGTTIISKVTIDSSGNVVATGDVTAYSDARLKSDIKDLEYRGPLDPKEYIKDGKKCIGFIAQDVRELYPELVQGEEKEDEYLSLNYGAITAVLAAENKELRKRIEKLETLINKLIEEK